MFLQVSLASGVQVTVDLETAHSGHIASTFFSMNKA